MSEEAVAYLTGSEKPLEDIFYEFLKKTGACRSLVNGYRPCIPPFFKETIPNAIVVLVDGGSVVYISKES